MSVEKLALELMQCCTKLDRLGCPQPQLTIRWSKIDICSIKRSLFIFAEEFANAELGQLHIDRQQQLGFG